MSQDIDSIIRLTCADPAGNKEIKAGDPVHISLHRVQMFYKVQRGRHAGMTRFVMNTPDEEIYVEESPKDIRAIAKDKSLQPDE
jgi:hypothetical protein